MLSPEALLSRTVLEDRIVRRQNSKKKWELLNSVPLQLRRWFDIQIYSTDILIFTCHELQQRFTLLAYISRC